MPKRPTKKPPRKPGVPFLLQVGEFLPLTNPDGTPISWPERNPDSPIPATRPRAEGRRGRYGDYESEPSIRRPGVARRQQGGDLLEYLAGRLLDRVPPEIRKTIPTFGEYLERERKAGRLDPSICIPRRHDDETNR